jgi:hypothetical protein
MSSDFGATSPVISIARPPAWSAPSSAKMPAPVPDESAVPMVMKGPSTGMNMGQYMSSKLGSPFEPCSLSRAIAAMNDAVHRLPMVVTPAATRP